MSQPQQRVDGSARRGRPPESDDARRARQLRISRQAVALFAVHGVAATTGDQIARDAGISERTLWRLFRTKESCVEPLLSVAIDAFAEVVRSWPVDVDLADHLHEQYDLAGGPDGRALVEVVRLTHDEPDLRAVWLLLHERSESVFAAVLATREGLAVPDVRVRVRAAAINAALRLTADDLAADLAAGVPYDEAAARQRECLATTLSSLARSLAR